MSHSCLLIHICWKIDSKARMEPLIHTEYLCFSGAMIFILITARTVISSASCWQWWGTQWSYQTASCWHTGRHASFRMSTSHFMMELKCGLVDATGFHTQEGELEEHLRTPEPLVADGDRLPLRLVALLQVKDDTAVAISGSKSTAA